MTELEQQVELRAARKDVERLAQERERIAQTVAKLRSRDREGIYVLNSLVHNFSSTFLLTKVRESSTLNAWRML